MSADKAVVGLRHGGLTAEMVPLLVPGRSVLWCPPDQSPGQHFGPFGVFVESLKIEVSLMIGVSQQPGALFLPDRFTYIGERGEDGWVSGRWEKNPVPGLSVRVCYVSDGERDECDAPCSDDAVWAAAIAFRLSDQQAAEPASAPVGIREADEPKAPAYQGAQGEEIAALRAIRDALLAAGGANPGDGMVRFSCWSLDKLTRAFDLAALQHKEGR